MSYIKFLKECEQKTQDIYNKLVVDDSNDEKSTRAYIFDPSVQIKTYYDYEKVNVNDIKRQNLTNKPCEILKTFVKLTNLTNQYNKKLHYETLLYSPTFEDDIYGHVDSHFGCNAYFNKSPRSDGSGIQ